MARKINFEAHLMRRWIRWLVKVDEATPRDTN